MADRLLTLRAENNRSWFSKASTGTYGLLSSPSSSSRHELPRWRSPSPMVASMIPPPIVQSTYAHSPSTSYSPAAASQRLDLPHSTVLLPTRGPRPTPLQHRQNELEADLQFLLDAQASALVRALEGGNGPADEQSSTGSTTPTAQSVRSASTLQSKRRSRPVRRTIGLKGARKGIYKSIVALAEVKDDEMHTLDDEVKEKAQKLAQIAEWEQKRVGLREATKATDEDEENVRAQRLRLEADNMQREINQVELQLMDMKARQRKLLRQAGAAENAVQAKLASYTSALSMLETDVEKFLSRQSDTHRQGVRPVSQDGRSSMRELPASHRTLEMARGQFTDEREAVEQQRDAVEREKKALDEGAAIWKNVMTQVVTFETKVAEEMALLGTVSSHAEHSAWEDPDDVLARASELQKEPNERLRNLLAQLNMVLDELDTQFKLVQSRDWKLLIAAIGAEVDALQKGKSILQSLLGTTQDDDARSTTTETNGVRDDGFAAATQNELEHNDDANNESSEKEINALDERFEGDMTRRRNDKGKGKEREREHIEDEEEDPDPELLFSTHGEDN